MKSTRDDAIDLGSITVGEGQSLMVTDPCYERGTWCQGVVENVAPGEWRGKAFVDDCVHTLSACLFPTPAGKYRRTKAKFRVGVDSGQAGIFLEHMYPHGKPGEYGDMTTFYGRACDAAESGAARIDEGFVSRSGYGDGDYSAYVTRDEDGRAVAVEVFFAW